MYERCVARDATLNGRFVTGVVSTGIYCLPSCAARKPLRKNIRFYSDEESAKRDGFRPCRRCRPDDFYRDYDPDLELVEAAIDELRRHVAKFATAGDLARRLGVGATKLTELFRKHLHDTPASIIRRERVARAADQLLTSTASLADIGAACGYESASAFYESFARVMRMAPGDYRKLRDTTRFTLRLPQGYMSEYPLRIFGRDRESISEKLDGTTATKALVLNGAPVILTMNFAADEIRCSVAAGAKRVSPEQMAAAHKAAMRLSGLVTDPAGIIKEASKAPLVRRLIQGRRELRIPQTATVFEAIAWAIVGQQVNLPFAFQLRRTMIELAGTKCGNLYAHPDAAAVAKLDYAQLTSRKFSRSKAEYLIDTARLTASGALEPESWPRQSATRVAKELMSVRGIGKWSANYVMMRGCGFADCVPLGDTGVSSGLREFLQLEKRPDISEVDRLMEQFAPYRSLATFHLWMRKGDPA